MSTRRNKQKSHTPQRVAAPPAAMEEKLQQAKHCHHQQGDLAKALRLYQEILASHPGTVEALHGASLICLAQNAFSAAIDYIDRALKERPGQPVLLYNAGLASMGKQEWARAAERFAEALRAQPDYLQASCQLARSLLHQKKSDEAAALLQKLLRQHPEHAELHELFAGALRAMDIIPLANYHRRLAWHYANTSHHNEQLPPQHTIFLDRDRALQTARRQNMIPETIQTSGLQVCYHVGAPLPDGPANLVPLPMEPQALTDFFCYTPLSQPSNIDFDPAEAEERTVANHLATLLYNARRARTEEVRRLEQRCQTTRPVYQPGQPLRVFIPAARQTDVMMFNARDLAQGFRQHGCEVLHHIESSNMETFYFNHYLQAQADFNPHVVMDINNYFKLQAHPDVLRVLWYTDPMPVIMKGEPFPWRERDLIYSLHDRLDHHLRVCGAADVHRQGFCYNSTLFQDFGKPRQRKIVLVASAHDFVLNQFPGGAPILAQMTEMFESGEPMTDAVLEGFVARSSFSKSDLLTFLWGYVVRNGSARWLCELATEMEVEVYGHRWETNPVVRPFYKGVLPHGPAVAALYNEAHYVFVPHPYDLQSQRLVEVSACGAVPVVYDCRYRAEKPHWDENCLWYRTREELRACLTQAPPASSRQICQGRSYTEFTRQILDRVESFLADHPSTGR
ncbi:MAG: tetratricopeptide repeat protein [Magnetococcus sp. MYC-9]